MDGKGHKRWICTGRSLQQQRQVQLASCNVWVASSFRGGLCENTDIMRTCLLNLPVRISLPVSTRACPEMNTSWRRGTWALGSDGLSFKSHLGFLPVGCSHSHHPCFCTCLDIYFNSNINSNSVRDPGFIKTFYHCALCSCQLCILLGVHFGPLAYSHGFLFSPFLLLNSMKPNSGLGMA